MKSPAEEAETAEDLEELLGIERATARNYIEKFWDVEAEWLR